MVMSATSSCGSLASKAWRSAGGGAWQLGLRPQIRQRTSIGCRNGWTWPSPDHPALLQWSGRLSEAWCPPLRCCAGASAQCGSGLRTRPCTGHSASHAGASFMAASAATPSSPTCAGSGPRTTPPSVGCPPARLLAQWKPSLMSSWNAPRCGPRWHGCGALGRLSLLPPSPPGTCRMPEGDHPRRLEDRRRQPWRRQRQRRQRQRRQRQQELRLQLLASQLWPTTAAGPDPPPP